MTASAQNIPDLLADYVDRQTLAKAWGVCTRTVARYEKSGLPHLSLGGRRLYPIAGSADWLRDREKAQ